MKVLIDLNVVLDVIQNRQPHYTGSAEVLSRARRGEISALFPAHAITTIYYVIAKTAGKHKANETVDWMLTHFEIGLADKATFRRARQLVLADLEDAVVASVAEAARCDYILTRNVPDFAQSPVPAISPTEFLALPRAD